MKRWRAGTSQSEELGFWLKCRKDRDVLRRLGWGQIMGAQEILTSMLRNLYFLQKKRYLPTPESCRDKIDRYSRGVILEANVEN